MAVLNLNACCAADFCEGQPVGVRTRLRVATTSGLRDEPLSGILSLRRFSNMAGAFVEWVQLPRDMHAVAAMLSAGLVDLAALHSEDAVEVCCSNTSMRVCGMFAGLPRRWSLLRRHGCEKGRLHINNCRIGIPEGTTARLALELIQQELETESTSPNSRVLTATRSSSTDITEYASLSMALRALRRTKTIDAVLWEVTIMEKAALQEWCDIHHELILPWPTHLFVANRETLFAKLFTVRHFMIITNVLLHQFAGELLSCGPDSQAINYLRMTHSLEEQEVHDWLGGQCKPWYSSSDIDERCIIGPLELIRLLDLLPGVSKRSFHIHRFLAEGSNLTRQCLLSGEEVDEADVSNCLEGAVCTPRCSHELHFMPRVQDPCRSNNSRYAGAANAPQLVGTDLQQRLAKNLCKQAQTVN